MTIYLLSLMHVKNCVSLIILLRENKRVKLWHVSNPRMLVVQWVDDNFFKNQQTFQYEQFQHTHVHTKYIMLYVMLCHICYIIYWAVLAGQWQRILLIKETQETRFDPWVGNIPWRRKLQSIPVFLPGKFHGQRNLVGYSSWSCKESETSEKVNMNTYIIYYITYFRGK